MGEVGLAGICDRFQLLNFSLGLWNTRDPFLKERAFGLTAPEGNHGEDVKEYYFYLDNTPTHSYMRYLYKYPQVAYPYQKLMEKTGNGRARVWNTNYWIRAYLMKTVISIYSSNTPKQTRTTYVFV